jgi:hypothetical protein
MFGTSLLENNKFSTKTRWATSFASALDATMSPQAAWCQGGFVLVERRGRNRVVVAGFFG